MSNAEPMTRWQQCRAILEALTPKSEPVEQTEQELRKALTLLAELVATDALLTEGQTQASSVLGT